VSTRTFTTLHDHQPDLLIRTYEGERSIAKENHLLGRFLLKGFSPAPRGMSLLEVTFYIDADGILSVFALDKIMGGANPIVVDTRKGRLSKEQIARLAEEHERDRASCACSVKRTSEDVLSYLALQARRKMLRCQQAFSWRSPAAWLRRRRAGAGRTGSGNATRGFKSLHNSTTGIKKRAKLIITTYSWTWQLTRTTTVIDP
ncbi:PREDICTED: heat shock 70 kDa protein 1A-like, partial [Tinamus guttatus]|uniref:heat shock 70 kDa protein 1A-like n=1 Tax=Tinamus guttatus TaxID=94827 RepID=UPI00052EC7CC